MAPNAAVPLDLPLSMTDRVEDIISNLDDMDTHSVSQVFDPAQVSFSKKMRSRREKEMTKHRNPRHWFNHGSKKTLFLLFSKRRKDKPTLRYTRRPKRNMTERRSSRSFEKRFFIKNKTLGRSSSPTMLREAIQSENPL